MKSDDDLAHRVDSIYDTITSSDTETDKKTGTLTGLIAMGMVCLTVIIVTWMIAR